MFTKKKSVLLFLLPGLLGLMLFYIVPFIGGIYYSLTDGSYKNAFVGLENYQLVWRNPMFQLGLKNTLLLSLICAPTVWILSFVIASLLNRIRPGGAFFRN
ncbi:MAG: sugar ABC transporter permease, partial [Clostridia bacterium]|nr:sugar ABC transporter permease [Clostridia bacterium]